MPSRNLTVREAIALYQALSGLDGHVETTIVENVKTGEKTTTTKLIPYVFGVDGKGGGKIRWNLAKNLDILKREHDIFTKARDALIVEISGGTSSISETDTVAIAKLNQQVQAILDNSVEVNGLLTIPLAELNLDANPHLVGSVLAPLMSLITE